MRALALAPLALAFALFGCSESAAGPGAQTPSSSAASDFSLPSLDGKTIHLSDYTGKVVLVDFWSTTCGPCLAEMPHIVELYKKYKDKGFVVLAVAGDGPESRAQVSSVVHDKDMSFPVLLDEESVVIARFDPKSERPFSLVIGKDGSIVGKHPGFNPDTTKAIESEIEAALAK